MTDGLQVITSEGYSEGCDDWGLRHALQMPYRCAFQGRSETMKTTGQFESQRPHTAGANGGGVPSADTKKSRAEERGGQGRSGSQEKGCRAPRVKHGPTPSILC